MNLKNTLKVNLLALVIGMPLGVGVIQPIEYQNTLNRLERIEKGNEWVAKDLAKTLAKPSEGVITNLVTYGTQKAARDYLKK